MAKFTRRELEIAVQVLMETDLVKNWAEGELRAFGIQDSTAREKFLEKQKRKIAERIIRTARI